MNNLTKFFLKVIVISSILFFIWDEVDFNQIKKLFYNPIIFILLIAAWIFNLFLTIFRLYIILLAVGIKLNFFGLIKAATSSMFVGNLLPGVIGADAVKFLYIKRLDPTIGKGKLALVLLLDRVLGLIGVLFWCSVSGLLLYIFYRQDFSGHLQAIFYLPTAILSGVLLLFLLVFIYFKKFSSFKSENKLNKIFQDLSYLAKGFSTRDIILAMVANLIAVFILLMALVYMGISISLNSNLEGALVQFFLIPLVLFSSMIPLAPLGFGLAQLSMAGAYELFGLSASIGIAVSTASQIALLLITLIIGGSVFMINSKSSKQ